MHVPSLSLFIALNVFATGALLLLPPAPFRTWCTQALITLNLSSNELDGDAIRSCAPHLGGLSSLESLDLSCNRIDALLGMPFLPRLSRLLVPYNRLESLDGVQVKCAAILTIREGGGSGGVCRVLVAQLDVTPLDSKACHSSLPHPHSSRTPCADACSVRVSCDTCIHRR